MQVEAERLGLPVRTPARLRGDPAEQAAFAALGLDAAVVAAYGLILPQAMLDAPRRGCLNIHASLLPRWRGAAPIQAAILAGDAETGVTIMQMDAGLDTGPMLLREAVPIAAHDHRGRPARRAGGDRRAPDPARAGRDPATGAAARGRRDLRAEADARCTAGSTGRATPRAIERQVRAFDPWPGTFTTLRGVTLKVLAAEPAAGAARPARCWTSG